MPGDGEAAQAEAGSALGRILPFDRGQLGRLVTGDRAAEQVANPELQRSHDRCGGQGHGERPPVVGVAAPPQQSHGVHGGNAEGGRQVSADHHVARLGCPGRVENRGQRVHVRDMPVLEAEPARHVHPRVGRDDEERRRDSGYGNREAHQPVDAGREPLPAVQVDAEEDGLDEEGERLEREGQTDNPAGERGEAREQQTQLEADDRSRHRPDREEDRERLRPAPRECQPHRVARTQVHPLYDQDHQRQSHPEHSEREVEGKRRSHLSTPGRQVPDEVCGGSDKGHARTHSTTDTSSASLALRWTLVGKAYAAKTEIARSAPLYGEPQTRLVDAAGSFASR